MEEIINTFETRTEAIAAQLKARIVEYSLEKISEEARANVPKPPYAKLLIFAAIALSVGTLSIATGNNSWTYWVMLLFGVILLVAALVLKIREKRQDPNELKINFYNVMQNIVQVCNDALKNANNEWEDVSYEENANLRAFIKTNVADEQRKEQILETIYDYEKLHISTEALIEKLIKLPRDKMFLLNAVKTKDSFAHNIEKNILQSAQKQINAYKQIRL